MASPEWTSVYPKFGVIVCTAILNHGDTSKDLKIPGYSDKSIHLFGGTFGDSTVSLTGLNDESGTGQALHRVHDPTLTFSSLATETLALLLENPLILRASAGGTTGTGLTIVIVGKRNI